MVAAPVLLTRHPSPHSTTCYLNSDAGTGANANSWTETFQITNASLTLPQTFTNPLPGYSCVPTPGETLGCPTTGYSSEVTSYKYIFNYTLTAVGSATGAEQSTVNESGAYRRLCCGYSCRLQRLLFHFWCVYQQLESLYTGVVGSRHHDRHDVH